MGSRIVGGELSAVELLSLSFWRGEWGLAGGGSSVRRCRKVLARLQLSWLMTE